jgi:hypothetical protein
MELESKESRPEEVDAYLEECGHPLKNVIIKLRKIILSIDPEIGEEVKWNAPSFFYAGPMRKTDPKAYDRYIIVFNLYRQDELRLVFYTGARIGDETGFLTGVFKDQRKLASFKSLKEVGEKEGILREVVAKWLATLEK